MSEAELRYEDGAAAFEQDEGFSEELEGEELSDALDEADEESGLELEEEEGAELEFSAEELSDDELDASDGFGELEGEAFLEAEELGEGFELDASEDDAFEGELADELGEFAFSPASGLYVPAGPRVMTGPAVMRIARQLEPAILEQLSADDADAFLRRIRGAIRGAARGIGRVARAAAPILSRVAPIVQRVASRLGPWGMAVSAGIGAVRNLAKGRGLGGALRGALGGLTAGIPGVGAVLSRLGSAGNVLRGATSALGGGGPLGGIARALGGSQGALRNVLGTLAPSGGPAGGLAGMLGGLLSGDGADDDADLDALADLADARRVPPAVALPLAAGLAARVVARRATPLAARLPAARGAVWRRARQAERVILRAGVRAGGPVGRRIRVMRAIARLAAEILRRRPGEWRRLPAAVRTAASRILVLARSAPGVGRVAPATAARKTAARARLVRAVRAAPLCACARATA